MTTPAAIVPTTAIVIPCYNEVRRLNQQQLLGWAAEHSDVRFVLVDDGSSDGTFDLLTSIATQLPGQIVAHQLNTNVGKAEAVRRGVQHALSTYTPDYFGYWDADLATPLDEVLRFIAQLNDDPSVNIVLGSRVKLLGRRIERNPLRHYAGRVFATAASATLRLRVYDTQCGAKLFRAGEHTERLFETPFTSRWVFDVELLKRYLRNVGKETIVEIPLLEWVDVSGSKVRPSDFVVAFVDLLRISFKE